MPTAKQTIVRDVRTGLPMRELTLQVLDERDPEVRARLAGQIARLDIQEEHELLEWMERVVDLDGWTGQE